MALDLDSHGRLIPKPTGEEGEVESVDVANVDPEMVLFFRCPFPEEECTELVWLV